MITRFHHAFKHYNVDVIDVEHSLDGYKVLLSPFVAHIDANTEKKIKAWVYAGGTWIVGPMSDIMTECGSKYTDAPFSFLEEYAGVYTQYQKPIPNEVFKAKWKNGETVEINDYYDAFVPTDSQSLIEYDGDEFGGYSVVTEKKVGNGRVIMLGSVPSHATLRKLTGLSAIAEASDNIRLVSREGVKEVIIALEQKNQEGYLVLDGKYFELLHGKSVEGRITVKAHEVLVLEKQG